MVKVHARHLCYKFVIGLLIAALQGEDERSVNSPSVG